LQTAYLDSATGRITAQANKLPVVSFLPVTPTAAPNLTLPNEMAVKGDAATPLVFVQGVLADADTTTPITLDMTLTSGSLRAATATGVTVTELSNGIRLTGTGAVLSGYLATAGNVQTLPAVGNGLAGPLQFTVNDGINTVTRSVALVVQKPVSLAASYNSGSLDIFASFTNSPMQIKRSGLNDIRLGKLDDELTVVRLTETPLVVRASEGADSLVFNQGNTVSKDGSLRILMLKDIDGATALTSQLANDDLTVKLKPQKTGTVVALGNGQLISGVDKVVWDENLGTLRISGDTVTLKALDADPGIDLGKVKLEVTAVNLTVVGNLTAQAITLNVSGTLTRDGTLTARDGTVPVIRTGLNQSTAVADDQADRWITQTEAPVRKSRMAHRSMQENGIERQVSVMDNTEAQALTLTRDDALIRVDGGSASTLWLDAGFTAATAAAGDIRLSGRAGEGGDLSAATIIINGSLEGSPGRVAMMPGLSMLSGDVLETVLSVTPDDQDSPLHRKLNGFNRLSRHALNSGELSRGMAGTNLHRSTEALLGAALHLSQETTPRKAEARNDDAGFVQMIALTALEADYGRNGSQPIDRASGLRVIDLSLDDAAPVATPASDEPKTESGQSLLANIGQRFGRWLDTQRAKS
jgi:hypothetical protein